MIHKVGIHPILHHQHTCCVNENGRVCRWGQSDYTPKWSPVVSPPLHVPRRNSRPEISKGGNKTLCELDQPRAPSKVIYQCSVCRWTSGCSGTQWLLVPKRIITQFLLTSNPTCTMAQQKSSVIQWIYNFLAFIYPSGSVCLSVSRCQRTYYWILLMLQIPVGLLIAPRSQAWGFDHKATNYVR